MIWCGPFFSSFGTVRPGRHCSCISFRPVAMERGDRRPSDPFFSVLFCSVLFCSVLFSSFLLLFYVCVRIFFFGGGVPFFVFVFLGTGAALKRARALSIMARRAERGGLVVGRESKRRRVVHYGAADQPVGADRWKPLTPAAVLRWRRRRRRRRRREGEGVASRCRLPWTALIFWRCRFSCCCFFCVRFRATQGCQISYLVRIQSVRYHVWIIFFLDVKGAVSTSRPLHFCSTRVFFIIILFQSNPIYSPQCLIFKLMLAYYMKKPPPSNRIDLMRGSPFFEFLLFHILTTLEFNSIFFQSNQIYSLQSIIFKNWFSQPFLEAAFIESRWSYGGLAVPFYFFQ